MEAKIDRIDCGDGWCLFTGGDPPPPDDQLPFAMHEMLQRWLRQNPHLKVRTVFPIVRNGNTIAVHVWFD